MHWQSALIDARCAASSSAGPGGADRDGSAVAGHGLAHGRDHRLQHHPDHPRHFRGDGRHRHRPSAHVAGRADHRARDDGRQLDRRRRGSHGAAQQGMDRVQAAIEAASQPAWPLLGATVVAVLAFYPIAASSENAGEYCASLFSVAAISLLLLSWIFSVTVTPLQCAARAPRPRRAAAGRAADEVPRGARSRHPPRVPRWSPRPGC